MKFISWTYAFIVPTEPNRVVSALLRSAIAFAFLYPPVAAYLNPNGWIWFVPETVGLFMSPELFLHLFGALEVLIGLAVLFMRDPRIPAAASAVVLAAIILLNWTAFDITFRDISILLAALGLILLHTPRRVIQ